MARASGDSLMILRRCCIWDEGRSLELGVPTLGSNHLKRLWSKAMVVSVKEKAAVQSCQIGVKKVSNTEPSLTCRDKLNGVKSRNSSSSCDKLKGNWVTDLSGVRHRDGTILIQAQVRNGGICRLNAKGKTQVGHPTRVKVPMSGEETDQPVVAMKSVKTDGAKGLARFSFILLSTTTVGGMNE